MAEEQRPMTPVRNGWAEALHTRCHIWYETQLLVCTMMYFGSIGAFRPTTECKAEDAVKAQMLVAQAPLKEISLKDAGVRCSYGAGYPQP